MSAPSPFEVSRAIGTNLSNSFNRVKDENAIERILSEASQSGDPEQLQGAIGKILSQVAPERQGTAVQYLQYLNQNIQEKQKLQRETKEKERQKQASINAGIDPDLPLPLQKVQLQQKAPPKEPKKTQASQPIDLDQLKKIQGVRSQPGFDELDEVGQYRALTNAGVSKENAEAESKLTGQKLERQQKGFESAYKAQEDFINKTTDSYKAFETETKPRLLQMQKLATDDEIISPTGAAFLEKLGIPYGALADPSSELYNKLSLDLLKGLPETYGNRIMKVEVDNFLKTIPSLLNSPEGRRMIASNMLKLGEMKEIYYNEMRKQQRDALDSNKPLSRDFQQRVFDQVRPQIDKLNNEFVRLSEIKSVPKGSIPFFNPMGEIEFVPKEHAQWAMENGGKRIW